VMCLLPSKEIKELRRFQHLLPDDFERCLLAVRWVYDAGVV
jgi:hypothetical protein